MRNTQAPAPSRRPGLGVWPAGGGDGDSCRHGALAFRILIGLVHNMLFLGELSFHYDANMQRLANLWSQGMWCRYLSWEA
jgi:hypothetical protein